MPLKQTREIKMWINAAKTKRYVPDPHRGTKGTCLGPRASGTGKRGRRRREKEKLEKEKK